MTVKEKVKEVELHKVQPVIHREREQKEIRHVVQPHKEYEVKDTKIKHREKDIHVGVREADSTLETSRSLGEAPRLESSVKHLGKERQHQELPAVVEECVHKRVEEHIHPVIYKETLKPTVLEETHHIYETVKERPVETFEVREAIHHDKGHLMDEKGFFDEYSRQGVNIDRDAEFRCHKNELREGEHVHHSHAQSHELRDAGHSHKHEHAHHSHELRDAGQIHTHEHAHHSHELIDAGHIHTHEHAHEQLMGHHQNIGMHHAPAGAVPIGHNTAYDAALYNTSPREGGAVVGGHSKKDQARMQALEEKKQLKQSKSGDKEQRSVNVV